MQNTAVEGGLQSGYGFISSFSCSGKLSPFLPKKPRPLLAGCSLLTHRRVGQHRYQASRNTIRVRMGSLKYLQGRQSSSDCLPEEHLHAEEGVVSESLEKLSPKKDHVPAEEALMHESQETLSPYKEAVYRRGILVTIAAMACLSSEVQNAQAVKQILLAGRVPGLSSPDENGLRTYHRPDAKSGGHGVGWSPIIPYSFKVPEDWEEVPVSIADLGGTEIDLRFSSQQQGNLSIVVAPVLRFASNVGDDARIEDIGTPEKVIYAFGPELVGQNVEGKVKDMEVLEHHGRKYYQFELDGPHALVNATAAGNRLYIMTVSANATYVHRSAMEET